ncbi:hypothetical protein GQ44DRAFT_752533 [Phaeosphaeriaceae sp. PMI808]|nr:hypothetical protein GQ44DRAFT_752533 [Phaeosphaeriaceae sp. PMI808]
MTSTTTYAVLGSTGNCGSANIEILLKRPDARVHVYCRNRSKLLQRFPTIGDNKRVEIFEGNLHDVDLIASCIRGCAVVFLCVSTNDNDSAAVVIKALRGLKKESESTGKPVKLLKVILLSSGTVDERFSRHVPRLLLPILLRSASYTGPTAYLDLAAVMVEVADDTSGQYDGKSVSMVCTNGPAKFPSGTLLCIVTGLLRHYFPWLHPYLPLDTGPR